MSAYLEIEKARFEDRLSVEVDVDPTLLEVRVPTFTLQPLLENAIKHGISDMLAPGTARIHVYRLDGAARIDVEDDAGTYEERRRGGAGDPARRQADPEPARARGGAHHLMHPQRADARLDPGAGPGGGLGDRPMMRAVIVDDEVHARRSLEAMLTRTGAFQVVGTCANAVEALQAIRTETPDVLFLDIQLPKVNGFQLLSMIDQEVMPHVVFVTAFDEYAVQAFEENALDYLLKPVERDRLDRTVEKLGRSLDQGKPPVYDSPAIERIPCAGPNSIRLVDVADVEQVRCSAAGVYVFTPRGEYLTDPTMHVLETKTDLERCHRQYLVNPRLIDEILRPEPRGAVLRMKSGREVPVSRRYFVALRRRLGLRRE